MDLFHGLKDKIDFRACARDAYERSVASKENILDIGGRNSCSASHSRLRSLSTNPQAKITSTDIVPDFCPDLVDDICNTAIPPNSFDSVYCNAILEHVQEYWKAIENIHGVLREGGEAFFYVPFFWHYHDAVDYHRFTFTEVARMLSRFSEVKICSSDTAYGSGPRSHGIGFVFWHVVTLTQIGKWPRLFDLLSRIANFGIGMALSIDYLLRRGKVYYSYNRITRKEYCFYWRFLFINHGFCAWVRK